MNHIGTTIIGLEEAAAKETSGKVLLPGRVHFKYDSKKEYSTLDTIYKLIKEYKFSSAKELVEKINKTTIEPIKGSFSCKAIRRGDHDFNSVIIEQEVGKALVKKSWQYEKKNAKNTVIIDIFQDTCLLGILIKKDLSKRRYRLRLHNQTTPPLVAAALIKKLDIKKNGKLLVLLSRDGVIPIEAALQGIKVTAQDGEKNNVKNAVVNAKIAKVNIDFIAESLEQTKKRTKKQEYVIAQIIFSKKKKIPTESIAATFAIAEKVKAKKIAIITNHVDEIEKYTKLKKEIITIRVGKADLYIMIFKRTN